MKVKLYKQVLWVNVLIVLPVWGCLYTISRNKKPLSSESSTMNNNTVEVHKKILNNGLVVLVKPTHHIPKVSMQILYHVGSKDEKTGEKGLAHLIEHMIFKGTKKLSESDINFITDKLSAYANAFTSHDTTGYVFDFPSQYWQEGIALFADCMQNARFDEQMLNSEMKAVIQELKMYKDAHFSDLLEKMLQAIFSDHPYHYPIIGFKQDLWSVKRDTLFNFYKKHYVPNNAVLAIVGDVDPNEVFAFVEKEFAAIKKDETYQRELFYHGRDLCSTYVTLARDIQQPLGAYAFVLPGKKEKKQYFIKILTALLGQGKTSRLYKKIVDELHLATDFGAFLYSLEDATILCMYCEPSELKNLETIADIIHKEIADILVHGLSEKELHRAIKNLKISYISGLENNAKQAGSLAENYSMTGDENYMLKALKTPPAMVKQEIITLLKDYCYPSMAHYGKVVSLQDQEKKQWIALQALSDQEDSRILEGRQRTSEVEKPVYGHTITTKDTKNFHFYCPEKYLLDNGLKVFLHRNSQVPKVSVLFDYNARYYHDPVGKEGLILFIGSLLIEGTNKHPGHQFAEILENNGIEVAIDQGVICMTMLAEDIELGLELLHEMLTDVVFENKVVEKIRAQLLANLASFWDSPKYFASHLLQSKIYEGHPYSKNKYGTEESIKAITLNDIKHFYTTQISPKDARLIVVGDIQQEKIKKLITKYFENLPIKEWKDIDYPALKNISGVHSLKHVINRDQVVCAFAGHSVARKDPDYDALALFDQILEGNSMNSRLFALREQTGLFYTISGSLVINAKEQPGFWAVQTIVSLDRLEEAKKAILTTLKKAVDDITQEELERARTTLLNQRIDYFSSNNQIATAFHFLDKFDLGDDYFDKRAEVLKSITLDQVKKAAKKILNLENMVVLEIGRLE